MNLRDTIKVNRRILALIASKYPEPFWSWPKSPESTYYEHLSRDTIVAEETLRHGGISVPTDEP